MEAHAGSISIGRGKAIRPRRHYLAELKAAIRKRRIERAERMYSLRVNGDATVHSLPGSEHSHLIRKPRGF